MANLFHSGEYAGWYVYIAGSTLESETDKYPGISIISSHFAPGKAKNKAFAVLGAGQPIGYIVGMILGGILSETSASWRTIFWLQAGLACILCIVAWVALPPDNLSSRYTQGLDWVGALLRTFSA